MRKLLHIQEFSLAFLTVKHVIFSSGAEMEITFGIMLVTMSDSKPTAEWPTVFLFLLALLLV
jgi:hypothetical protein